MAETARKVLILHTSVGLGHQSIAENIGANLREAGYEVRLADIGKVQQGTFQRSLIAVHKFINSFLPFVWGWLYSWGHYLALPFRTFIAGFNYKATLNLVHEFNPDVVIATQTTASAVVAFLKRKKLYKGLFGIAFSDFHLHRYWLYDQADFYLCNIEEQKEHMVSLGIPQASIFVCGMQLSEKPEIDLTATRQKFGLQPQEKVVLVSSGSLGSGITETLLEELLVLDVKIIVVCGKNEAVYKQLRHQYQSNPQVFIFGFVKPMDELYAIADVYVTKPGGLTVAESLRYDLPLIVSHMLPGQEQLNLHYLLKHHLVMDGRSDIVKKVQQELATGQFRKSLAANSAVSKIVVPKQVLLQAIAHVLKE